MFRKLMLALGAAAVIGATALSPTAASAKHWHHWRGHYWYGGYYPYYASNCYTARQVYWDVFGKHVRYVRVCN